MSAVTRQRRRHSSTGIGPVLLMLALFFVLLVHNSVAHWMATGTVTFVNPVTWWLTDGNWTGYQTAAAVLLLSPFLLGLVITVTVAIVRHIGREPIDVVAPLLGHGRTLGRLRPRQVRKKHKRVLRLNPKQYPGIHLGYCIKGRKPLRGTYEDSYGVIAGPRMGKSRGLVIPNVLMAPGAVVSTSVKPDVLEATGEQRSKLGRLWVFDPQGKAAAHHEHRAWWNPLARVHTIEDAERLAKVLCVAAYGESTGGKDQFFSMHGRTLLGAFLFAAAVGGRPITDVSTWLADETDDKPVDLLKEQHPAAAADITAEMTMATDTRSGVYGYARGAVAFLASAEMRSWVTPRSDAPAFDEEAFANAPADTAYLISEESGGAGPLIAALTEAITRAAEDAAARTPSGRRELPMLLMLDEAANICRLPDLPSKYSTWGGRGIVAMTILQSQAQGEQVWGSTEFEALWSAATVQVFAGGNATSKFRTDLIERIGTYEVDDSDRYDKRRRTRQEPILDHDDLQALGENRALVLAQSTRPVLVKTVPINKDWRTRLWLRRRAARLRKEPTRV